MKNSVFLFCDVGKPFWENMTKWGELKQHASSCKRCAKAQKKVDALLDKTMESLKKIIEGMPDWRESVGGSDF